MSLEAKPSSWDSDLFGYRVGLLDVLDIPSIDAIVEANLTRFDVIFVKTATWIHPHHQAVTAVDNLYEMETFHYFGGHELRQPGVSSVAPQERHLEIARTAFHDGRFSKDPRLAGHAQEMYARWVGSCEKILTLRKAPEDAFLIPDRPSREDGPWKISLVAVDERRRRTGIGSLLILGAMNQHPGPWTVRVLARNFPAVRCYENLGFKVKTAHTAFHVWTNEGE